MGPWPPTREPDARPARGPRGRGPPRHGLLHRHPDPDDVDQQVAFGTSGHRGTSLNTSFNETHIAATTQAICDYRREQGYDGPLFIGRDTHGLSEPAWATALEVLVANDVTVLVDDRDGYTPTPGGRHAIIRANAGVRRAPARRRHRRDAVAQPARGRRLQVQPAARRPGRLRRDERDRGARQRADPRRTRGREAGAVRAGAGRRSAYDFLGTYVDDLPERARPRRDPRRRGAHRRRPAGRRERGLLGRDRRAAPAWT